MTPFPEEFPCDDGFILPCPFDLSLNENSPALGWASRLCLHTDTASLQLWAHRHFPKPARPWPQAFHPGRDRQHPHSSPGTPARRHTRNDMKAYRASPAAAGARRCGCPLPARPRLSRDAAPRSARPSAATHRPPRCRPGDHLVR